MCAHNFHHSSTVFFTQSTTANFNTYVLLFQVIVAPFFVFLVLFCFVLFRSRIPIKLDVSQCGTYRLFCDLNGYKKTFISNFSYQLWTAMYRFLCLPQFNFVVFKCVWVNCMWFLFFCLLQCMKCFVSERMNRSGARRHGGYIKTKKRWKTNSCDEFLRSTQISVLIWQAINDISL